MSACFLLTATRRKKHCGGATYVLVCVLPPGSNDYEAFGSLLRQTLCRISLCTSLYNPFWVRDIHFNQAGREEAGAFFI